MAFLGGFGKLFGISTPEAAQIATSYATGGLTQAALTTLGSLGEDRAPASSARSDVSAPPAGIDSPASVSRVSQTSRTFDPSGFEGRILGGPAQRPMQAGFGLAAPLTGLIGGAARTLARPGVGGALTGFGTGMAAEFITDMFGNTKKLVITRKLQRDVKKVFMMSGGDVGFISMNSLMLFGKDLSQDQILMILFKTFKNQGPYVTKAAVRKTRQTIRKLDTLEQLKAQMCPPRRAPARRRTMGSTTKVLQVK
jgi:hypothetical protein